jgi:hypothetical protein
VHERRLSALGPGGLNRKRAGFEVRDVHISHYGRICPIETPEGTNIGLIASLGIYAEIDDYGFLQTPYREVRNAKVSGKVVKLRADEELKHILAPSDAMDASGNISNIRNPKLEKVLARRRSNKDESNDVDLVLVEPGEVQFVDISPKQIVGVSASLIPFLEHDDANRALMGSNMQRQAVPLVKSDPPCVATGMERVVGTRAAVLDTGSLADPRARSVVSLAVMGFLRRRTRRQPILLVIDEAHNVLAPNAPSALERAITDYGVWVAGEGRKYGVHLVVSTQRPQKIHRNVVSQCDNLILMRMNSVVDIEELASVFSHVPKSMIAEARSFAQGEMLVAGPIATPAMRLHVGERWCPEGGADLPTTWAFGSDAD